MLKINLLPGAAERAARFPLAQFHRTPLLWIVLATLCGLVVLFAVPIQLRHAGLHRLTARVKQLQPKKAEVDKLQQAVDDLRARETGLRNLRQGAGRWSQRLNALSELIPDGIWYTELMLEPAKGLLIQGSAVGQGGSEMVSVGRLVQDLRAHPQFRSVLKDLQIESIKRVQREGIEVVQFTLAGTLTESAL
jgi:Tfp pilus assembly protein PilN